MVSTVKFSQFANAGTTVSGDVIVGLNSGVNSYFTSPPQFVVNFTNTTQPSPATSGMIGYNTDILAYQYYNGTSWLTIENTSDLVAFIARLAAHTLGDGASLVGLQNQSGVSSKTVQDLANAGLIAKTNNGTLTNGQFLSALSTGIVKNTTGTGVLSISAPLTSIDGLSTVANEIIYTTGSNVYATAPITALARSLIADSTTSAMQATLGLGSASTHDISFFLQTANNLGDVPSPATARSNLGLGTAATKAVTDNSKPNVASTTGAFIVGHVLLAADTSGTIKDGGSPAGMGTVTNIATGTGLTGGPITTTGSIEFADVSNNTILANISGSSSEPPIPNTLSDIIDSTISNVQGSILYRGVASWLALAPGTNGFFLETKGIAANPIWSDVTASTGIVNPGLINEMAYYASSGSAVSGLATANNGVLFTNGSGAPSIGTSPIVAGGTGVTSVTTIPTATSFAGWDANSNFSANSLIEGYATTATAAATTTLLVVSKKQQYFTGSTTQTVLLPVTSTLILGQQFYIVNNSSGVVTVQSSGANTIQAMAANTTLLVTCILTSGTTASSWNYQYVPQTSPAAGATIVGLQNGSYNYVVAGGTGNALTAVISPAVTSYVAGLTLYIKSIAANTLAAVTLNVNGLGTKNIKLQNGSSLSVGSIPSGMVCQFVYDGTNFHLLDSFPVNVVTPAQVQDQTWTFTLDEGTANNYTDGGNLVIIDDSYIQGQCFQLLIANANTGASTLNLGAIGAAPITYSNGAALTGGELVSGMVAVFEFDGTNFQLLNPVAITTTSITFSPTTGGIVGTTTNDNATTGKVGEFVSNVVPLASAVSCTTATARNVTSISLTAGDWDICGNIGYVVSGIATGLQGWISLTSATAPNYSLTSILTSATSVASSAYVVPTLRVSITSTTTVYLSCTATFSTSTVTACGTISARRVR